MKNKTRQTEGIRLSAVAREVIRESRDPLLKKIADPDPQVAEKAAKQAAVRCIGFKVNM